MSYAFFFSHARDDFSPYMEQFLADLREAVRGALGLAQAGPISFRDKDEMDIGLPWRQDLLDGLQQSNVMVCLYTPRYFQRPICGKEVGFFVKRQKLLKATPQHALILPVIWIPCETKIPETLRGLTFDHSDFPPEYRGVGLDRLNRLKNKYGDKNLECVAVIADRIKMAIENQPPLPQWTPSPPLDDVPNAFETPKPPSKPTNVTTSAESPTGPGSVQFYYAIAKPEELGGPPPQPTRYDSRGGPFFRCTDGGRLLGPLASNVASSPDLEMVPDNCEIDEDFPGSLRRARSAKNPVVVFVDPWTLQQVQRFRDRMAEYEGHQSDHCSVLVLWNSGDPATNDNHEILEARVQATFPVNATRDKIHFRPDIKSEQGLTAGLRESLERLRHKIIEQGKVERMLATANKPILEIHSGNSK